MTDRKAWAASNLRQNSPNPFNPITTIAFDVPAGGQEVSLRIYDASGRLTRTLIDGYEPSGTRTVSWDGKNDDGQPMASGIYYCHIVTPTSSDRKMMMLLK
jgi:flagellar hook assembly protein FlgD